MRPSECVIAGGSCPTIRCYDYISEPSPILRSLPFSPFPSVPSLLSLCSPSQPSTLFAPPPNMMSTLSGQRLMRARVQALARATRTPSAHALPPATQVSPSAASCSVHCTDIAHDAATPHSPSELNWLWFTSLHSYDTKFGTTDLDIVLRACTPATQSPVLTWCLVVKGCDESFSGGSKQQWLKKSCPRCPSYLPARFLRQVRYRLRRVWY